MKYVNCFIKGIHKTVDAMIEGRKMRITKQVSKIIMNR